MSNHCWVVLSVHVPKSCPLMYVPSQDSCFKCACVLLYKLPDLIGSASPIWSPGATTGMRCGCFWNVGPPITIQTKSLAINHNNLNDLEGQHPRIVSPSPLHLGHGNQKLCNLRWRQVQESPVLSLPPKPPTFIWLLLAMWPHVDMPQ